MGYYGDFVYDRHLQLHRLHRKGHNIDKTELFTNAGYIALNICNRFDLFGTLGSTNLKITTDAASWGFPGSVLSELHLDSDFSWSIGGRSTLWQFDCFSVGIEAQYFQVDTSIHHFFDYNDGSLVHFNDGNDARYSEWQAGLGISYRFATRCPTVAMVPYAAVKWSGANLKLDNFTFVDTVLGIPATLILRDLESSKLWGYAIGMSLTLSDTIGVTAEGRWADEKAFYINGQFRF